jgi:hypothetical protein
MELVNSKRLLYSANYVATLLTPDEQHKLEKSPGGGYRKANLIRALRIPEQEIGKLRELVARLPATAGRGDTDALFSVLERLAATDRPMTTMTLAAAVTRISDATIADVAHTCRSPRVLHTHLHAYACRIYVAAFRTSIGL